MSQTAKHLWSYVGALPLFATLCFGADNVVQYANLKETRLPYNQKIAIQGDIADFPALNGVAAIKTVSVSYGSFNCGESGLKTETPASAVAGGKWTVAVGPFDPGEKVCFTFTVSGNLTDAEAAKAADALWASPLYEAAVIAFFDRATGQPSDVMEALARSLAEQLAPVIADSLPKEVQTQAGSAFTNALSTSLFRNIAPVSNLRTRVQDLINFRVPRITATMSASELRRVVGALTETDYDTQFPPNTPNRANVKSAAQEAADLYKAEYDKLVKLLIATTIKGGLTVAATQTDPAAVKYLEKYAAVDVGSLWIPRIDEFRAFAMLHIYWGPTELEPPPANPNANKGLEFLKNRTSLMFGYSLKNISSSHDTKIRGNNVWVYGLGFRINRYFRLNVGSAIYRGTPGTAGLRNDFVLGPSLDLTAIEYFKGIFAKIK